MRQLSLDLFHSHRRLRALNKPIYLPIICSYNTLDLNIDFLCFEGDTL